MADTLQQFFADNPSLSGLAGFFGFGGPQGPQGGYGEGVLNFTNLTPQGDEHTSATAVNPKTGNVEYVYAAPVPKYDEAGNPTWGGYRYYFESDPDRPAEAHQIGNDTYSEGSWGSAFDTFMGDVGVPAGLAAMAAAGPGAALLGGGAGAGTAGVDAAGAGSGALDAGLGTAAGGSEGLGSGLTAGTTTGGIGGGSLGTGLTAGTASETGLGLGSGITSELAGNAGLTGSLGALSGTTLAAGGLTNAAGLGSGLTTGEMLAGTGAGTEVLSDVGDLTGGSDVLDSGDGGSEQGWDLPGDPGQWTDADWTRLLGSFGPALLGYLGANQYSGDLRDIANQQHNDWLTLRNDRMPFLDKGTQWLQHPGSYMRGPGQKAIDATLRGLSVTGNPFGSPLKMEMAGDAGLRSWQNAWQSAGAIGTGTPMAPAPTADMAAAGANAQGLNAIGYGIGNYFNPPPSFADYMKQFRNSPT